MRVLIRSKSGTTEPLEKRFNRFAKALMAVPKKELDEGSPIKAGKKPEQQKRKKPGKA